MNYKKTTELKPGDVCIPPFLKDAPFHPHRILMILDLKERSVATEVFYIWLTPPTKARYKAHNDDLWTLLTECDRNRQ